MTEYIRTAEELPAVRIGTLVEDKDGAIVTRVLGGWSYDTDPEAVVSRYTMVDRLPLRVLRTAEEAAEESTQAELRGTSIPARVVGRLYWNAVHPSPWVTFEDITAYRTWASEIRMAVPGTRTEYRYIDWPQTADNLLRICRAGGLDRLQMNQGDTDTGARP